MRPSEQSENAYQAPEQHESKNIMAYLKDYGKRLLGMSVGIKIKREEVPADVERAIQRYERQYDEPVSNGQFGVGEILKDMPNPGTIRYIISGSVYNKGDQLTPDSAWPVHHEVDIDVESGRVREERKNDRGFKETLAYSFTTLDVPAVKAQILEEIRSKNYYINRDENFTLTMEPTAAHVTVTKKDTANTRTYDTFIVKISPPLRVRHQKGYTPNHHIYEQDHASIRYYMYPDGTGNIEC